MSKTVTTDALLSVFPAALGADKHLYALASSVATSLVKLYKSGDLAALYTRIDCLNGDILDILAYDFKIDWWDASYSVAEKRRLFKSCWDVHRKLGTPAAIVSAISSIYPNVSVREWWQYGGKPYRFRLSIDTGGELFDSEKFSSVVEKTRFYKNLRSILEEVDFRIERTTGIYIGCALQIGLSYTATVAASEYYTMLTAEDGVFLTDEKSSILIL